MDRTTIVRTTLAGGIAGLGLAVGGIAVALADDDTGAATSSTSPSGFVERHGQGPLGEELATRLAEELDVAEADVSAALDAVREGLVGDREDRFDGTPPTEAERETMQDEMAQALADELGVDAAAVEDAFEALRADLESGARDLLADRLDDAVDSGDLTAADRTSVLKAFDAGVLGGGMPGGGFGHGGPGR